MKESWNRGFGYALAVAALCGFVAMGTSCKKDEPKEEPAAQQDDGAKAEAGKKDSAAKDDKKAEEKKDDGAKADAADEAKPDENAEAPAGDPDKYPLFKFTLKYTPETARVGVLYGNADCKDGSCSIETTSETNPIQINVHAEGYDNKSVTIKEKVENYEINLVKSAPAE